MRNVLLVGWLMLPIGAWAYHEGPGLDRQALDKCDVLLVDAHAAADVGSWQEAIAGYEAALAELPDGNERLSQRIRLELNKARIQNKGLNEAREDLEVLVEHLMADEDQDKQLLADARQSLARAQFFTTWLMRLEGLTREQWEPEIEAARQNWRLLAEQATTDAEKSQHQKDLEAAIKLERLEIEDLQGLPLPSE
ncbi:MAG: hypothetical protein KDC98_17925 [Planctomycetes bacterium]|nr:hypothetical protein [Planctomycetota bacterium]